MSEIPEDILEKAGNITDHGLGVNIPGALRKAYIQVISEAMYAERLRCAEIAERFEIAYSEARDAEINDDQRRTHNSGAYASMDIGNAIKSGKYGR